MGLKPKQQLFLNEYLIDMNATQAAIRAGYSPHSAYSMGQKLLKKGEIQAEIQRKLDNSAMKSDEILQRLTGIARADMGDYLDISSVSFQVDLNKAKESDKLKYIRKIKQHTHIKLGKEDDGDEDTHIEFELLDQQRALETLAKYRGLLVEKQVHSGDVTLTIKRVDAKPAAD